MQQEQDIRWEQRLEHFKKALVQLHEAVDLAHSRALTSLESQGLIKAFEFCQELSWNVLKDYFANQGNLNVYGSRDAYREAFQKGLIEQGEAWMDMIKSRNLSSHTYNHEVADYLAEKVIDSYVHLFDQLSLKLSGLI